jgi:Ferritin-like domain
MRPLLTRRDFAASAAFLALGLTEAAAANAPEEDVAWLRLSASAELVAHAFLARAAASRVLARPERRRLREALSADRRHYAALAAEIGVDAPVESDFSIGFRRSTFGSRARLLAVGVRIKRTLVGLNLGATTSISDARLRAVTGRIAASEASHLSYLSSIAGGSALGAALPTVLDAERATQELTPFWG